ncbi:MAG: hypothetical protein AAF986_08325, partial [Pseudomonadota bacterium]
LRAEPDEVDNTVRDLRELQRDIADFQREVSDAEVTRLAAQLAAAATAAASAQAVAVSLVAGPIGPISAAALGSFATAIPLMTALSSGRSARRYNEMIKQTNAKIRRINEKKKRDVFQISRVVEQQRDAGCTNGGRGLRLRPRKIAR